MWEASRKSAGNRGVGTRDRTFRGRFLGRERACTERVEGLPMCIAPKAASFDEGHTREKGKRRA